MSFNLGALGSLYIELRANLGSFETDLGRAARVAEREGRKMARQASQLAAAAAASATAQGAAFSLMVKRQIDSADSLGKVSQASGVAVEQLSRLDYAARAGGVNDLDRQLQTLHKNTILATKGTGQQADAFRSLGVDVRDANGAIKSGDVLLLELADAFASHADGAGKSAAAQALFGDSAAKMIPLLNGGSQAIREAMTEAERFGLVVDTKAAANAAKFNDNLFRVQAAAHGVANRVAQGLLPTMIDLSNGFVSWAADADTAEKATRWVDGSVKGLIVTGIALKSVFQTVGTMIGGVIAAADRIGDDLTLSSFAHPAKLLWDLSKSAGPAAEILREAYGDARDSVSRDIEAIVKVIEAGQKDVDAAARSGETGRTSSRTGVNFRLGAASDAQIDEVAARALQARLRGMEQLQSQARSLAESLRTPEEKWQAQIAKIDEYYNQLDDLGVPLITAEERTRALAAANDEYYRSLDALDGKGQETFNRFSVFADQAARNMQTSLADFFFDPFEKGLSGLADSFSNTLRRMAAELLASEAFRWASGLTGSTNPILGAIGNIAGGFFAGGGSSGSSLNFGGGTSEFGIDYAALSFGGGRARGGDIQPNRWYTIGEDGPEQFYSGASGTVVPFAKMGAQGGGTKVEVHNYSGQQARTERATGPNGEELIRVVIGEVSRSIAENGTVGRTMATTYGLQRRAVGG